MAMPGLRDAIGSADPMEKGGYKNYTEVPEDNMSPNRAIPELTAPAIAIIANFVERVPETNVKFQGDTFTLSYQRYAGPRDQGIIESSARDECDNIVDGIQNALKANNFSPSIEFLEIDVNGMGWSTFRNVLFTVRATYNIKKI